MSREQATTIEAMLRDGPLDLGGDLTEQRPLLDQLMTGHPLPEGIRLLERPIGGVPAVWAEPGDPAAGTVLYLHGGAYALGSARGGAGLGAELAVRSGRRAASLEYRLAPEHPYPAAVSDVVAACLALLDGDSAEEPVVIVGESAGGGLALAALQRLVAEGHPRPAAAVLFSPWADLSVSGRSATTHAAVDPALTPAALRTRSADYAQGVDIGDPGPSPVFGVFDELPPMLVQVGSHEILLDDAVRVTAAAAAAHVEVTLQVTPHVPHVFQGFAAALDEGCRALDAAADFVTAHLPPA